jgi:hypothetical protein
MSPETVPGHDARTLLLLRVLALSTLGMMLLSWPLWVEQGDFPRVPFLKGISRTSTVTSFILFGIAVLTVGATGLVRRPRGWYAASVAALTTLVIQDQHRFQPWIYQYAFTGLLLTTLRPRTGLRYARWWIVSLYVYSGLSKLDRSFHDELGAVFLATILRILHVEPATVPDLWRWVLILAMPLFELVVAIALLVPRTRRLGVVGASGIHLTLIVILGPLGLGHSAIVLVWNAAMLAEAWIAFGPESTENSEASTSTRFGWLDCGIKGLFWAGVLLPLGERWELFDAWPSHALYASHVERLEVYLHESELEAYPLAVRRHLTRIEDGPWYRLNLTAWSRDVRGTPVYPQTRACLGLAEALAARYGVRGLVRVVLLGPTDRWTGRRASRERIGLEAIRHEGDRYLLNAHPTP